MWGRFLFVKVESFSVPEQMKCVSPVCCCCCWRASFLSRARCLFSSMRLRCSSVRDGAAGEEEGAGEGEGGAAGAGVEWTGAGRSFGKTVLLNGSGSPKTCNSGAAASSTKQWVTESSFKSQFEPCSLSYDYYFMCQGSVLELTMMEKYLYCHVLPLSM